MNYLAYDIECFKYNTLVIFKTLDNEIYHVIWLNGPDDKLDESEIKKLDEIFDNFILFGYNNYFYDDCMMNPIYRGCKQSAIKKCNDRLIGGIKQQPLSRIKSLDMYQQIDGTYPSLKMIEGNMGKSIVESSVSFEIDRELTESEKEEVFAYCSYDVESTIDIFKLRRRTYFETKDMILNMLGNPKATKWNTTTIIANILVPDPLAYKRSLSLIIPDWMWYYTDTIPNEVWEMWKKGNGTIENIKGLSYTMNIFNNEFTFGFGGLHGAPKEHLDVRNVKLLDVGSMYPSIIINLNALGSSTKLYDSIRKERLSIKKTDPLRANALKLILNSTYGLLKNQYSLLNNPRASSSVCIYGQIALFVLCEMLDAYGYKIINANTDGVAFLDDPKLKDGYKKVQQQWEKEFSLFLELDEFDRWVQRDVNNYVAVKKDGKLKLKGGDVKWYMEDANFANNSARIIQIALVDYLLYGTSPFKSVYSHLDQPKLYQYILRTTSKFKGVYDGDDNQYQKVNRVFPLNPKYQGVKLYKKREDGGLVNFPNAPDNMWVYNGDLATIPDFSKRINLSHYINIVNNKIKEWR